MVKTSVCVGVGLAFFALALGSLILFPGLPIALGLPSAVLLTCSGLAFLYSRYERPREAVSAFGAAGFILTLLYFLGDPPLRAHAYFQSPFPVFSWFLVSLVAFFCFQRRLDTGLFHIALLGTLFSALLGFFISSRGMLLITDDHPCFLYRLIQLKEYFPNIPFYNPFWNAGVEAREFFPSGALNFFFLFSPFIYLFDVTEIYTALVLILLFVLVPLFSVLSALLLGGGARASAISGILSVTASLFWYRWSLAYGTLGFLVSAALVPLNLALLGKLFEEGSLRTFRALALLVISLTLMLLWSPSALLFFPIILPALRRGSILLRDRKVWLLLGSLVVLNAVWVKVFLHASSVGDFLSTGNRAENGAESGVNAKGESRVHDESKFKMVDPKFSGKHWTKVALYRFRQYLVTFHPLILFFGISGLFFLRGVGREVFLFGAGSAFGLALFGPFAKPQLELERMFVVLALVLATPAGIFLDLFLRSLSGRHRAAAAALSGVIFISPYWIWRITTNHTSERYTVAGEEVSGLIEAITTSARGGRVLFSGFVLHELNNGHIAPLAAWTKVPLIASSYQHDRWRYTEVVPELYKRGRDAGMERYFDLLNVSAIVAHDRDWQKWISARPERFERVWGGEIFHLYRRKQFTSNYFLEGSGEVLEQQGNAVILRLFESSATLKFSYFPFLRAEGCDLKPFPVDATFTFVRLENCRIGETVKLESRSPKERFF